MNIISIWFDGKLAGRLALYDGAYTFKYAASYLNQPSNIAIDPINLPLQPSVFHSQELFGAMRDALPDSWGRFLLAKNLDIDASRISDMDCITGISGDRVGCIVFGEVVDGKDIPPKSNQPLQLCDLQSDIGDMDYECSQSIARLLHAGSSMGGARPKANVIHNNVHYIAKFNQHKDTLNVCRCEHAAMSFARQLGIHVADTNITTIQGSDVLMVKRFDRHEGIRDPFLSALTISGRNEFDFMHSSYVELNQLTNSISPHKFNEQWLRRMTYNVLCNNDDDHLRNHGFIAKNGVWELSPAYDIMPHATKGETYRLAIGLTAGNRNASLDHAVQAGIAMGVDNADSIVNDMQNKFSGWQSYFEQQGVSDDDIAMFERIFNRFNMGMDEYIISIA